MAYDRLFSPDTTNAFPGADGAEQNVYVYDDDRVVLAVNVALAASRPLLVYGSAGSGKSTLAANVAQHLGRPYLEQVITSRTEADDLLWRFDALERLSDAHTGQAGPAAAYYRPGVLWEAFTGPPAVVLIDEIDKADPDLPNGLLAPLGSFAFTAPGGQVVKARPGEEPLVMITSNDERDLPRPFLRRCVVLTLREPDMDHLRTVARAHLGDSVDDRLVIGVADAVLAAQAEAVPRGAPAPSTAEFLDTLRACRRLGIDGDSPEWDRLLIASLTKSAVGR